jgi:hypothetical protein
MRLEFETICGMRNRFTLGSCVAFNLSNCKAQTSKQRINVSQIDTYSYEFLTEGDGELAS